MTSFLLVGDQVIHYRQEGRENGLPLVFINSLGTDFRIWDDVIAPFIATHLIVRYDKRGHGLSDCGSAPYTLRDHSHDLTGLLDDLQIDTAVIVGISVGGMIAIDFASLHPEKVKALVLCDTQARIGTSEMWNTRIHALQTHGMAHLADAILERWFALSFRQQQPAAYRGYRNMFVQMPVDGYTATCAAIRDADLASQLATIQARTLVLCGAEDMATPLQAVQGMANTLPDSQFRIIEGAGHLPCIEQPQRVAQAIQEFLEEIGYG